MDAVSGTEDKVVKNGLIGDVSKLEGAVKFPLIVAQIQLGIALPTLREALAVVWISLHIPDKAAVRAAAHPDACPGAGTAQIFDIVAVGFIRREINALVGIGHRDVDDVHIGALALDHKRALPKGIFVGADVPGILTQLDDVQAAEAGARFQLDERRQVGLVYAIACKYGRAATLNMALYISRTPQLHARRNHDGRIHQIPSAGQVYNAATV